jgi:hypothetical protein
MTHQNCGKSYTPAHNINRFSQNLWQEGHTHPQTICLLYFAKTTPGGRGWPSGNTKTAGSEPIPKVRTQQSSQEPVTDPAHT